MSEPIITPTPEPTPEPTPAGVDYEKLEEIVNKGVETKVSGILKSYAEQNSLNLDELKTEFQKLQDSKKTVNVKDTDDYKELQAQYETLQNTVKTEKLETEIKRVSTANGLTTEQADYVIKQLKTENLYKEDGTVNSEKITEEIEKIGTLFNLKLKKAGYPGKDDNNNNKVNLDSEMDQLRKMIGLKSKN
jgi:hypothetical protein